jgi:hypothetical protein
MVSKSRRYRKSRNNQKLNENKIQFLNIGSTNTTVRKNDTVTNSSSIDWSGKYNGKVADIHVLVDDNGRKEEMNMKLDNNDLTKLFGFPSINKQLDQRLIDDFYEPQIYESQVFKQHDNNEPQVYEPQSQVFKQHNNNDRQLVDIMKSLKNRKATGHKTTNNRKNRNTNTNKNRKKNKK